MRQNGKWDKLVVRCAKRSAPRLHALSTSVQCHVRIANAPSANGFEGGFTIGGRLVTNLRYADDIVLIASTREELQELVNRVHSAAVSVGMRLNVKKTETMGVSDDKSPITVKVGP